MLRYLHKICGVKCFSTRRSLASCADYALNEGHLDHVGESRTMELEEVPNPKSRLSECQRLSANMFNDQSQLLVSIPA